MLIFGQRDEEYCGDMLVSVRGKTSLYCRQIYAIAVDAVFFVGWMMGRKDCYFWMRLGCVLRWDG